MSFHRLLFVVVGIALMAIVVPKFAPVLLETLRAPVVDAGSPQAAPSVQMPQINLNSDTPRRLPEPPRGRSIALRADDRGHYQVDAVVNGRSLAMMVDTGATTVALNAATARRLGIYLSRRDYTVAISTANGPVAAAPVKLSEVRVGRISVRNVQAVVLPGSVLDVNLLGMSFLSRLSKFQIADGRLILEE